jgi:tRNA nucleotidyltransferase/poly(A) polymerase
MGFNFLNLPETKVLFGIFKNNGIRAMFVGGCVRDAILGLETDDYDVAINANIDHLTNILREHGLKYTDKWIRYNALKVTVDEIEFDVVALRRDVENFGRDCRVVGVSSFEEDAKRRDFTMNALYLSEEKEIFDYCGGFGDLEDRKVVFIGNPSQRIAEDHIRILRYYRFCTRIKDYRTIYSSIMKENARFVSNISKARLPKELFEIICDHRIVNLMYNDNIWQNLSDDHIDIVAFNRLENTDCSPLAKLYSLFSYNTLLSNLGFSRNDKKRVVLLNKLTKEISQTCLKEYDEQTVRDIEALRYAKSL